MGACGTMTKGVEAILFAEPDDEIVPLVERGRTHDYRLPVYEVHHESQSHPVAIVGSIPSEISLEVETGFHSIERTKREVSFARDFQRRRTAGPTARPPR